MRLETPVAAGQVLLRAHLDQTRGGALEFVGLVALHAEIEPVRLRVRRGEQLHRVVVQRRQQQREVIHHVRHPATPPVASSRLHLFVAEQLLPLAVVVLLRDQALLEQGGEALQAREAPGGGGRHLDGEEPLQLFEIKSRGDEPWGAVDTLKDGRYLMDAPNVVSGQASVYIRQTDPLPLTLLGVYLDPIVNG